MKGIQGMTSNTISKMNKTLKDEDFVINAKAIEQKVEHLVKTSNISYIDALIEVSVQMNCEVELIAKFVRRNLKDKVMAEASELNMLKEKIPTLPV